MQRSELELSDQEIIQLVKQHWDFSAIAIEYIDIGCAFAFKLKDAGATKVFLKIHRNDIPSDPIEPQTTESITLLSKIVDDLRRKHGLINIPESIKTRENKYFHEEQNYIFMLSKFIEGSHPAYEPNELKSAKLANILTKLHAINIKEYPQIKRENFDISYALGIKKWLNITTSEDEITQKMLDKLIQEKTLIELQSKFLNNAPEFVLTHGDGHHFNILQNETELFLLDWENLKIAVAERDLWHYDDSPLLNDYLKINPNFTINYELFRFYQLQRFLEDLQINIEKEATTEEQKLENLYYFLYKRNWDMFNRVMRNNTKSHK